MLKSILTYHVVSGGAEPRAGRRLAQQAFRAPSVNVTGNGNALKVNNAGLVCGGVPTANAYRVHDRHGADAARPSGLYAAQAISRRDDV